LVCFGIPGLLTSGNDPVGNLTATTTVSSIIKFDFVEGLILIRASTNGQEGNFILDTGSPCLLVNKKVKKATIKLWTAHGDAKGESIEIRNFKFGHIEKINVSGWGMDLDFVEDLLGRPIAGIIGTELLKNYKLLIDFEQMEIHLIPLNVKTLDLKSHQYVVSTLPIINSSGQLPIVKMNIDNRQGFFAFDTGAAISVINNPAAAYDNTTPMLKDVNFNKVQVRNMSFVERPMSGFNEDSEVALDGIISVSSLNASKVIIDPSAGRIHLFWSSAL
jgi:hypothetical protein